MAKTSEPPPLSTERQFCTRWTYAQRQRSSLFILATVPHASGFADVQINLHSTRGLMQLLENLDAACQAGPGAVIDMSVHDHGPQFLKGALPEAWLVIHSLQINVVAEDHAQSLEVVYGLQPRVEWFGSVEAIKTWRDYRYACDYDYLELDDDFYMLDWHEGILRRTRNLEKSSIVSRLRIVSGAESQPQVYLDFLNKN